ncbi:binding-protein-dependent transport system inner membrane protein [Schlesneria paludicola]|uniref:binding-protein-dependent transport system inner membrane protein n=1 Tax=Schlesneria paludicola TaxID=360056 RepID=UPI00029B4347|nr:binding-protein-dependent transport system inner membrane protein [Schlesneria paludicola]
MATSCGHIRCNLGQWFGLLLLVIAIVFPMCWVIGYSVLYSLGGIGALSEGWTLKHWHAAFTVGGLRESLLVSPLIAGIVTVIAVAVSIGIVLIAPQSRHSFIVLATLGIPLATPAAVVAVMTYQILSPGGLVARLCFHAGWVTSPSQFPALVNDPWAIGIIVAQSCTAIPLLSLFFLKTWTTARIDRYCQLAQALGASQARSRWRIGLPMLLSRGRQMIILTFLLNLGSYEIPLLLGRQSPQMFSVLTQRRFGQFNLLERPQAFVLATTYVLLVGIGVKLMLAWRRSHE